MSYKQFCPIAKAMEVVGERWTLLVVRELLMGSRRFNELQRGLPGISPTLLTKRLGDLEEKGLLIKKRIPAQKGYEYFPTNPCKAILPVLEQIGQWGMQWARDQMLDDDFDPELLMLYLERSIQPDQLPGSLTVIRFNFIDVQDYPNWWIVVEGDSVEVCVKDPGKEVDVYFNCCVRVMCELWMGEISYKRALADGRLQLIGPKALTRNVTGWLAPSIFAGMQPASDILS
jgi:DNA-binding HxlR family transcriptional regulator